VNRYRWDAIYINKAGLWLDIKIMGKTLAHCFNNLIVGKKNGQ
jgi:lipopolysaccharide/colanic/teichoic acid biosynthesis glycosyltransferase